MPNPTSITIPTPIATTAQFTTHPIPTRFNNPYTTNHPTPTNHQVTGRAKLAKIARKLHCLTSHHQHTNHTIPHTATQPNSRLGTCSVHNFQHGTHLKPVIDPKRCLHPPQVQQGS